MKKEGVNEEKEGYDERKKGRKRQSDTVKERVKREKRVQR